MSGFTPAGCAWIRCLAPVKDIADAITTSWYLKMKNDDSVRGLPGRFVQARVNQLVTSLLDGRRQPDQGPVEYLVPALPWGARTYPAVEFTPKTRTALLRILASYDFPADTKQTIEAALGTLVVVA